MSTVLYNKNMIWREGYEPVARGKHQGSLGVFSSERESALTSISTLRTTDKLLFWEILLTTLTAA